MEGQSEAGRLDPGDSIPVQCGVDIDLDALRGADVIGELEARGVGLNRYARDLLTRSPVTTTETRRMRVRLFTAAQLGARNGGTWAQLLAAGQRLGLDLVPLAAAPVLRLALMGQADADTLLAFMAPERP